jgi:hypothetical protein
MKDSLTITEKGKLTNISNIVKTKTNNYTAIESILTASQAVTSSWADLGSVIELGDFDKINAFISVDINDSEDVRFKVKGLIDNEPTKEYEFMSETLNSGITNIKPSYFELTDDKDIDFIINLDVLGCQYAQIQVQAGTVGSSAGLITDLYIQKSQL